MINDIVRQSWINFKKYFKAQLKLFVLAFVIFAVGLSLLDISYAVLIALGIALLDFIPVIGSGLIFVPWAVFNWIWGSSTLGWQLALLYILAVVIEEIAGPLFIGKDLSLPFWVPLVITIVCGIFFNVFGFLVAAVAIPVVSAVWHVLKYRKGAAG